MEAKSGELEIIFPTQYLCLYYIKYIIACQIRIDHRCPKHINGDLKLMNLYLTFPALLQFPCLKMQGMQRLECLKISLISPLVHLQTWDHNCEKQKNESMHLLGMPAGINCEPWVMQQTYFIICLMLLLVQGIESLSLISTIIYKEGVQMIMVLLIFVYILMSIMCIHVLPNYQSFQICLVEKL